MIHHIYVFSVIFITIFVLIYYCIKNDQHEKELNKIKMLEEQERKRTDELEKMRSKTIGCPYGEYNNPRDCYIKSDNRCSWNTKTKRCEPLK